jgi:hypothetical protein
MIYVVILANNTAQVPYGVLAPGALSYRVTSNGPVDSYLVDPAGRDAYFSGQSFPAWTMVRAQTLHAQQIVIHSPGQWYLLVRNLSQGAPVEVYVDISYQSAAVPTGLPDGYYRA